MGMDTRFCFYLSETCRYSKMNINISDQLDWPCMELPIYYFSNVIFYQANQIFKIQNSKFQKLKKERFV